MITLNKVLYRDDAQVRWKYSRQWLGHHITNRDFGISIRRPTHINSTTVQFFVESIPVSTHMRHQFAVQYVDHSIVSKYFYVMPI